MWELENDQVSDLCKTVHKPGGGEEGHQTPKMAVMSLQLLVFYAKHLDRTKQKIDIVGTRLKMINDFRDQKRL